MKVSKAIKICLDYHRSYSKPNTIRAYESILTRFGLIFSDKDLEEISSEDTMDALDLPREQLFVYEGKGSKGRVVYLSNDAYNSLVQYLKVRPSPRAKRVFLVEKGRFKGKPVKVRGIQHCMQHYAQKAGLKVSCHQLSHTMATQLLNADADLVTIQDLLGHTRIKTTQRYCRVSNLKVQRDYHKAIERVMHRHTL